MPLILYICSPCSSLFEFFFVLLLIFICWNELIWSQPFANWADAFASNCWFHTTTTIKKFILIEQKDETTTKDTQRSIRFCILIYNWRPLQAYNLNIDSLFLVRRDVGALSIAFIFSLTKSTRCVYVWMYGEFETVDMNDSKTTGGDQWNVNCRITEQCVMVTKIKASNT